MERISGTFVECEHELDYFSRRAQLCASSTGIFDNFGTRGSDRFSSEDFGLDVLVTDADRKIRRADTGKRFGPEELLDSAVLQRMKADNSDHSAWFNNLKPRL